MRWAPVAMLAAAPWLMAQTAPQAPAMQRILAAHNAARAALGLAPLAWNADIAEQARSWASELAKTGDLSHAGSAGRSGNGENLWAGTRGRYSPEDMIGSWVAEKRFYRAGRFPRQQQQRSLGGPSPITPRSCGVRRAKSAAASRPASPWTSSSAAIAGLAISWAKRLIERPI